MSEASEADSSQEWLVVDDQELKSLAALSLDEAVAVRRWWQRLALSPVELKQLTPQPGLPRGVRAALRRCDTPDAALLTQAFRELWHLLPEATVESPFIEAQLEKWSCIALVLAELRNETPGKALAARLGQQASTGKPIMSELRFQQILTCRTPEELVQRLRRALALAGRSEMSAVRLADVVALWWREYSGEISARPTHRFGFMLANDYFGAAASYRHEDT
ncbi:type I-E CRISPR-associated protein Cse2/CasB [Halomonas piscis]|uniref:Type I-E CRISPR-associated protein Cse2/CasB n=1 Tax=Halomonas piscis TaxID=3031727 RepID=A0ABY9Z2S8_9GAMM|nr:type I-E CRISPR-associated protein Cse2/CasB [Halomonas piscis]WNK20569.1 type I-E CRISPR-associated protein Cse2/CasB [Halomonas piscis]